MPVVAATDTGTRVTTPYPSLASLDADNFAGWLSGFMDGEACLGVYSTGAAGGYVCMAVIELRADDGAVLWEISERTGLGRVRDKTKRPVVRWAVTTKADCARLAEILEAHPLRGKKAREVPLWCAAVREWCREDRARGDWALVGELCAGLHALKRYRHAESAMRVPGGLTVGP